MESAERGRRIPSSTPTCIPARRLPTFRLCHIRGLRRCLGLRPSGQLPSPPHLVYETESPTFSAPLLASLAPPRAPTMGSRKQGRGMGGAQAAPPPAPLRLPLPWAYHSPYQAASICCQYMLPVHAAVWSRIRGRQRLGPAARSGRRRPAGRPAIFGRPANRRISFPPPATFRPDSKWPGGRSIERGVALRRERAAVQGE
jgi:hypothetical protein